MRILKVSLSFPRSSVGMQSEPLQRLGTQSAHANIPTKSVTGIKLGALGRASSASSQAPAWEFSAGSSSFPTREARASLTGFPSWSLGTSTTIAQEQK